MEHLSDFNLSRDSDIFYSLIAVAAFMCKGFFCGVVLCFLSGLAVVLLREGAFACWFSLVVFKAVCFL